MEESYQVEGIHYDDSTVAAEIALRLFTRYNQSKTILIYGVDHHGEKHVIDTLEAVNDDTTRCPDTLDLFGGL